MRGAHAPPGVAVEIFVEEHVVTEMRIGRELGMILKCGTLAICTFKKEARKTRKRSDQ